MKYVNFQNSIDGFLLDVQNLKAYSIIYTQLSECVKAY